MSKKRKPRIVRYRASTSFREPEIEWLVQLMATLLRGGDARVLMKSPASRTVYSKVQAMKRRLEGDTDE